MPKTRLRIAMLNDGSPRRAPVMHSSLGFAVDSIFASITGSLQRSDDGSLSTVRNLLIVRRGRFKALSGAPILNLAFGFLQTNAGLQPGDWPFLCVGCETTLSHLKTAPRAVMAIMPIKATSRAQALCFGVCASCAAHSDETLAHMLGMGLEQTWPRLRVSVERGDEGEACGS